MYPFIRTIIRESMMPRVWTLQKIEAVSVPTLKESIMKAIQSNPENFNGYEPNSPQILSKMPSEEEAREMAIKSTQM